MNPIIFFVGLVVFLWSSPIGEEILPDDTLQPPPIKKEPAVRAKLDKPAPSKDTKELRIKSRSKIDHKLFLQLFAQQSFELDLRACLQGALKQPTGELGLAAELQKNGRLKHIRTINDTSVPECAESIISKMLFNELTKPIETSEHTIIWNVNW